VLYSLLARIWQYLSRRQVDFAVV